MRAGAAWVCAMWMAAALGAQAAPLQTLLATERQQMEAADYRISGRLVRVDASGERTSDGISIKARGFPGVLRVLVEVTSPAQARVHILLETRFDGRSSIEIAHPGDRAPAALPFKEWSDGPLGSGFSYEDFLDPQYFWPAQTTEGEAAFGARQCDVVLSKPGAQDRTHYSAVKTWLDQKIDFPVYVEKTLKGTEAVKEFTYFGLRHNGGVWSASQVEVKARGQAGSTLLIIEHGSAKANLNLGDFGPAQLTRF